MHGSKKYWVLLVIIILLIPKFSTGDPDLDKIVDKFTSGPNDQFQCIKEIPRNNSNFLESCLECTGQLNCIFFSSKDFYYCLRKTRRMTSNCATKGIFNQTKCYEAAVLQRTSNNLRAASSGASRGTTSCKKNNPTYGILAGEDCNPGPLNTLIWSPNSTTIIIILSIASIFVGILFTLVILSCVRIGSIDPLTKQDVENNNNLPEYDQRFVLAV